MTFSLGVQIFSPLPFSYPFFPHYLPLSPFAEDVVCDLTKSVTSFENHPLPQIFLLTSSHAIVISGGGSETISS